jgi:hypothetical protein
VSDEGKTRRGGRESGEAAAAPTLPASVQAGTGGTPAENVAAQPARPTVEDGDSEGRTKVPLSWALDNGERVLGIPRHVLVAAFEGDEREELTLNAVRKTVAEFEARVQNPDVAEEA